MVRVVHLQHANTYDVMDKQYNKQYDAYYDADTGEWLEKKCGDPECEFCVPRPERAPLEDWQSPV